MEIAKEWLHMCETSHLECLGTDVSELPTRVIDVGIREDWMDLRITQSRKERAAYIALSHCWGGPITPMLTSKTIYNFQDRLPFLELPANFRDAITITRRLGFRYLWIDSLCIIQDSREDWAQESRKMGLVYRNATVTVSAMASKGSEHGIIPRDLQTEPTFPLTASVRVSKASEEAVIVSRQDFNEESLSRLDNRCPLSSRGWCLQESILSPRHLYYGIRQIYWRCPKGYQAADGTSSGLRIPHDTFPHLSAVLYRDIWRFQTDELPTERRLLQDYYSLVESYSHRSLTFSSDKLPAFSGISERLHPLIGGKYLAGIWAKDLAAGLLWQREMSTCKHVQPYRAPSWSWAVSDEEVLFYERDAPRESSIGFRLVDDSIHLKDETNPYGEIESASITVQGLTLPLIRSRQHIQRPADRYFYGHLYFDDDPPRYEDDNPNMPGLVERTMPILFMVEDVDRVYLVAITFSFPRSDSELEIEHSLFTSEEYLALIICVNEPEGDWIQTVQYVRGLVIKPVYGGNEDEDITYERVGKFDLPSLELSQLQAWETRTLILV